MRVWLWILTLVAVSGCATVTAVAVRGDGGQAPAPAAAPASANAADAPHGATSPLYHTARQAAVEVLVDDHLAGSGWFADADGAVITAAHVVGSKGQRVELRSPVAGRIDAKVIAIDLGNDVALLSAPQRDGGYPWLPFATDVPAAGTNIHLFGAPQYRHAVLLQGSVARDGTVFEYIADFHRYIEVLHVSAATPVGTSGGPWLNQRGQVVGLQSAMMTNNGAPVGISFMVPAGAIARLLKTRRTTATPTLGAPFEEAWEQQASFLRRVPPRTEGLVILAPPKDGPIARAGLVQWDTIIAADGKPVQLRDQLLRAVRAHRPGQKMTLTVLKPDGGGQHKVSVELATLEAAWLRGP